MLHEGLCCVCRCYTDVDSSLPTAVDQQNASLSADTSSVSASLPSDADGATAAVTMTAAVSESQPVARFVMNFTCLIIHRTLFSVTSDKCLWRLVFTC